MSEARILIPDEGKYGGGIQTFGVNLVRELSQLVRQIIWVLPQYKIEEYRAILPESESLKYEVDYWRGWDWRKAMLQLRRLAQSTFEADLETKKSRYSHLAKKHKATHIFYLSTTNQQFAPIDLPASIVVYDLNWRSYPNNWSEPVQQLDAELKRWIDRAQSVFAISQASANEVLQLDPSAASKLVAVPLAVIAPSPRSRPTRKNTGKAGWTFLCPSSVSSHKGHMPLFKAARALAESGVAFTLVLSGSGTDVIFSETSAGNDAILRCREYYKNHRAILEGRILAHGYVSNATLEELYDKADAVIFPSEYEGFGLPVIESVARGLPVICSDIPAIREQVKLYKCDDRVKLVTPGSSEAIVSAVLAFMQEPIEPAAMDEKFLSRFAAWTWRDVAHAYASEFAPASS